MTQAERDDLVVKYGYLARLTAKRYIRHLPSNLELEDLVSEGYLGLLRAAELFDASRGVLFTTFAIAKIRGAILESLRNWDWVPRTQREKEKQGHLRITDPASLDVTGYGLNGESSLKEFLKDAGKGPEEECLESLEREELQQACRHLPARERRLLTLYYQDENTFKTIGAILGVSESRAYQLHGQAIRRLRQHLSEQNASVAA